MSIETINRKFSYTLDVEFDEYFDDYHYDDVDVKQWMLDTIISNIEFDGDKSWNVGIKTISSIWVVFSLFLFLQTLVEFCILTQQVLF